MTKTGEHPPDHISSLLGEHRDCLMPKSLMIQMHEAIDMTWRQSYENSGRSKDSIEDQM
jgi:hypothetical protein